MFLIHQKEEFTMKIILWAGITIFILGTIINFFMFSFSQNNIYNLQNPLLLKLSNLTPVFMVTLILVINPILEELIFRYWTINNRFSYIVSLIGISLFCYFYSNNFLLALTIFILLLFIIFVIKNILLTAVFTSIIFTWIHVGNTYNLVNLFPLFGLSLIFTFISLKYNIRMAFATHIAYNLVAIIPLMISFEKNLELIKFENISYQAQLNEISIFSLEEDISYVSQDSILVISTLSQLIPKISNFKNNTIISSNINSIKKFRLIVTSKSNKKIDKEQLIKDLVKSAKITSDTSKVNAYIVDINNNDIMTKNKIENYYVMLYDFIDYLKTVKGLPVKLSNESLINQNISVSKNFLFEKKHDKLIKMLNSDSLFSVPTDKKGNMLKVFFY